MRNALFKIELINWPQSYEECEIIYKYVKGKGGWRIESKKENKDSLQEAKWL